MVDFRLSLKEMCERFDVTPRTIRYYEYIELLSPEHVGRGRIYGPREVARMTLILRGRRFGFSLEEIRKWLTIYDQEGSDAQTAAWLEKSAEQLSRLEQERDQLDETIRELRALREETLRKQK